MIPARMSGEKRKIHPPVFTLTDEMRMSSKGVISRVFQDKRTLLIQDLRLKYQVGEFRQCRMIIRGVCENDVKRLDGPSQVFVDIRPDYGDLFHLKSPAGIPYEPEMGRCQFDGCYGSGPPGGKFIGNASRTREQVQYIRFFQGILVDQDIEQAFLRKIGGRPGIEISRCADLLPSEFTADYAHLLPSERIMNWRICSRLRCSRK